MKHNPHSNMHKSAEGWRRFRLRTRRGRYARRHGMKSTPVFTVQQEVVVKCSHER